MRFPVRSSRLLAVVLAVLAAVVALTPPAAAAAAAARSAAGTRVGASRPVMIFTVGASTAVSAGGGRRGPAFRLHLAVGACVAAEDVGSSAVKDAAETCGGMSFTPGTKVLLASGTAVPISQLRPGMKVLATNTKTGKTQAETVTAVLVHHDTDLYDLKIRDHGETSVVDTTSSHLFWVPGTGGHGGRWVKAGALKYGTHLRTPGGSGTAVVTGGWVPRQSSGWMWDLTVPGGNDHDFYIDTVAADVLVHNCGDEEDLLSQANEARDAKAAEVGRAKATVTGGYDPDTGEVVSGCSSNPVGCAEDDVTRQLGGDPETPRFTTPVRPRTGEPVPICARCQGTYSPGQFPPGTPADPSGPWGLEEVP